MRVVIRRPHAYEFLQRFPSLLETAARPDLSIDAPPGAVVIDGSKFPIPGIVFLDADGELRGMVPMMGGGARERLLGMMEDLGSLSGYSGR